MISALALVVLAASPARLEPPTLQLSAQPDVPIVFVVPGVKALVVVSANGVGAVSATERIADGRFRARFTFPKERAAQLALLRLELEEDGGARTRQWLALPLIASADLKIETKPRASVTVTIGEATFGPAIADARGKVTIPAKVAPGIATATVLAVDRAGNRTTQPLDLQARQWPRAVGALVDGPEARAGELAQLELFAVEADGKPLASASSLTVTSGLGAFEGEISGAQGQFLAAWRAPASVTAGPAVLSIAAAPSPATLVQVTLRAGPAARLDLGLTPPQYVAGAGAPLKLRVLAVDAHGNPLPLENLAVTTDFGRIEPSPEGLLLHVPDGFEGKTKLALKATGSGVAGQQAVPLLAAAPTRADLAFPTRVTAGETARGQVVLADRFGNPVDRASVFAEVSTGRGATTTPQGGGAFGLTLPTEAADPAGDHELKVTADGQVVARGPLTVMHHERRWAVKVGVAGFAQTNFTQWVQAGPRVSLGLRIASTGLDVGLEGAFGRFFRITAALAVDGVSRYDIELRQFSLLLAVRYWIPLGVRLFLHASLAGGLQNNRASVSLIGDPNPAETQERVTLAARAGAGLGFHVAIGKVVLQLEYNLVPSDGLVNGNVGGAGLTLGYVASF